MTSSQTSSSLRFIDIGSNLGDHVFRGRYHGKQAHEDDFADVLERARQAGVEAQLLTGGDLSGSKGVLKLAEEHENFFCTAGCHPCNGKEPLAYAGGIEAYISALDKLLTDDAKGKRRIRAVGECGLDYDRLFLCDKESQLKSFPPQHTVSRSFSTPEPQAHQDFVRILRLHDSEHGLPKKGVVHSFTGTLEEMQELVEMGYAIGVNGCSLKTAENLEVVKAIPLESLLLETDCPYCDIRPSHASHALLADLPSPSPFLPSSIKKERHKPGDGKTVKSRNEPCSIGQVAWVVSKLKGIEVEQVAEQAFENTKAMFGMDAD